MDAASSTPASVNPTLKRAPVFDCMCSTSRPGAMSWSKRDTVTSRTTVAGSSLWTPKARASSASRVDTATWSPGRRGRTRAASRAECTGLRMMHGSWYAIRLGPAERSCSILRGTVRSRQRGRRAAESPGSAGRAELAKRGSGRFGVLFSFLARSDDPFRAA